MFSVAFFVLSAPVQACVCFYTFVFTNPMHADHIECYSCNMTAAQTTSLLQAGPLP